MHYIYTYVRIHMCCMKFQDIQRKIFILRVEGPSNIVYAEFQLYVINKKLCAPMFALCVR